VSAFVVCSCGFVFLCEVLGVSRKKSWSFCSRCGECVSWGVEDRKSGPQGFFFLVVWTVGMKCVRLVFVVVVLVGVVFLFCEVGCFCWVLFFFILFVFVLGGGWGLQ